MRRRREEKREVGRREMDGMRGERRGEEKTREERKGEERREVLRREMDGTEGER